MSTIDENIKAMGNIENEFNQDMPEMDIPTTPLTKPPFDWMKFLKTPTGNGSIEDYIDKPFNFSRSHGMAQILRGLAGFLGTLDFALVDIIIGMFNFAKERRSTNDPTTN